MVDVRCVAPTGSQIGEGPVWDEREGALWWVDIPAGIIHRHEPGSGANDEWQFGEPVGCVAVRDSGGLVLAAKSGFWFFDPASGEREHIADPEDHLPDNRFNDGTTDMQGRFWAGTMKDGSPREKTGAFYRLDPDLTVTRWRGGYWTTNGMAFSPDGRTIYFADTNAAVRTIWASDYDAQSGTPGEPCVFFDTRAVSGRPDGGTVDAEGCYWQAGIGGWQLYRISPDGKVILTVDLPVEKPSKPMFGGANLDILFVTSIGEGLTPGTEARQPDAGGLFAVTGLGVKGLPQTRFAG